nr:DUF3368 domain-containing protein [Nodosilinea sp. TSF1-S3]
MLYLLLIDQLALLPRLYNAIVIPDVVQSEMQADGAPEILKLWIAEPPDWLDICLTPEGDVAFLQNLQMGEQAAILLAQELQADLIILDDLAARKAAQQLDLTIIGMLGILGEAARRGWIDLPSALNQLLQDTNFRVSPQLIQDVLGQFS